MGGRRGDGRLAGFAAALVVALLALSGCSGAGAAASAQGQSAKGRSSPTTALGSGDDAAPMTRVTSPTAAVARPTKLLVVVLENHAPDAVEREMPWLTAQAKRYGTATTYYALAHPSLPNYLAMAGGSTFGVRDDRDPDRHPLPGGSVFGQGPAGAARTYAEGMREPCEQSDDGRYAVRHNPWTYFPDEHAACLRDDVPAGTPAAGALQHDVAAGTLPTFGLLIPDVCNDAHDCELPTADRWLESWVQAIEAGADWKAGRLAVLVTFDEDDHTAGNRITAVVMHPALRGVRVDLRLDHRDLSASASRLLGGEPLREAAGRPGVLAAFGLA